ncbi:MAG TPA: hypothetical protein VIE46_06095 [Gemmatimonadales bacterium]
MTDPRRYNDEEVAAIFLTAAECPQPPPLHPPHDQGLTLAELQEIGREVGIAPDAVAQAAQSLDLRGQAVSRRFLGLPIGVERTVALNRWLSEEEWEHLVVELREIFNARGTVRSQGSLRQWTNGNLHALLEPTPGGHRLRLGTLNGNARASMGMGLVVLGISAAVAVAGVFGGSLVHAVPGIVFLAAAGVGMFANGVFRLPGWARLRGRQMEGITARLALPAGSPPPLPPPVPRE